MNYSPVHPTPSDIAPAGITGAASARVSGFRHRRYPRTPVGMGNGVGDRGGRGRSAAHAHHARGGGDGGRADDSRGGFVGGRGLSGLRLVRPRVFPLCGQLVLGELCITDDDEEDRISFLGG